jgi:5'-methylthioadenosine phosphorylase
MTMAYVLAVIGGSGFYAGPGLKELDRLNIETPYGSPSNEIIRGQLGDTTLLFLARHGARHQIAPQKVNYRANVCALKMAGATHILSLSAVGSMRNSMRPGDVVVVSDFIDLTRTRINTFFDTDVVAHVAMARPICPDLAVAVAKAAKIAGACVHANGTYVCIEGPQFSTLAESRLYRTWNVDVIGMTAMPEAKLAREAELPYAIAAFVSDYDCWNDTEAEVSVDLVVATLKMNADLAPRIVSELVTYLPNPETSPAHGALKHAVITDTNHRTPKNMEQLAWLLGTYRSSTEGQPS